MAALALQGAKAQDETLPQPGAIASPGSVLTAPSSQPLPTNPAQQNGGDVPLTPVNPVPANPLPPLPKLELDTSKVYKPVLPELPSTESSPLFGPKILVKHFVFTGNTVYDSATLDKVVEKYTGREIDSVELEAARQAVTLYYVAHGYINSGALLPDQNPSDGIIHMTVVEGKLTTITVTGNHWFQTWWLRNEMRLAGGEPLNFNSLKEGLQVLRENPTIAQVNAELQPGGAPGESQLKMEVKDAIPFRFSVEVNNYRPPSVGSTIAQAHAADLNLTGNNDPLSVTYGIATSDMNGYEFSDLDNIAGDYTFPISPWRTTMEIGADKTNSGIIEAPFNQLNIDSKLVEYHLAIHQPIFETPKDSLILSFQIDKRRNSTSLFGEPFSLTPGAVNGAESVTVPRFIQEFVDRGTDHVFSARSQFSFGIDAAGATINAGPPDGHFFAWLGQTQYVRRIGDSNNLIIGRLSGQIADRPLLSVEQLELGGISSVRGYLENQVLSDNGVIASIEGRIPIWEDKDHNPLCSIAPFTDFGLGWDNVEVNGPVAVGTTNLGRQGVAMPSVGIGVLFNPCKYFSGQLYWGYGLNRRQEPGGESLQNDGIEFSVSCIPL
ncbi:MAG TPA: ShlB/FhaC/HecB family hemolysin secretion/activation protein [Candidatus Methylacidiphilales bacterium]|nr:ShlB/FhaC/HecB family hemolysin secretion/activation protein [Candidatus Methylacidiphilales bacterium]